jgi:GTP cyclohydrolase II
MSSDSTHEPDGPDATGIREHARASLPSKFGTFMIVSFVDAQGRRLDDVAIVKGEFDGDGPVAVRVHSECVTGDAFGSLRCDCGDQLALALRRVDAEGAGVVVYLRQEGRGIGIANKVKAYTLQDAGLDTVDANEHLGFDVDLREYGTAAGILRALGVEKVALFTNNPAKVSGLASAGIEVARREPIVAVERAENADYLDAKRRRMGHEI